MSVAGGESFCWVQVTPVCSQISVRSPALLRAGQRLEENRPRVARCLGQGTLLCLPASGTWVPVLSEGSVKSDCSDSSGTYFAFAGC